jgi:hypothetical protein
MALGSIVTPVLEVFGVWTASTFLFAGIGGFVALKPPLWRRSWG